jgi:hypothetical protein
MFFRLVTRELKCKTTEVYKTFSIFLSDSDSKVSFQLRLDGYAMVGSHKYANYYHPSQYCIKRFANWKLVSFLRWTKVNNSYLVCVEIFIALQTRRSKLKAVGHLVPGRNPVFKSAVLSASYLTLPSTNVSSQESQNGVPSFSKFPRIAVAW